MYCFYYSAAAHLRRVVDMISTQQIVRMDES